MDRFADLLDRLVLTASRNAKLRLLETYFREVPDPDRGLALAALTSELNFASVKPGVLRQLAAERMDPVLFAYSHDYVGDLAETLSLVWPGGEPEDGEPSPSLAEVVGLLQSASRASAPAVLTALLDRLHISARFAAIKLVTGGLRIGLSSGLAKQALANIGGVETREIEELWHGLKPPYLDLFAWLDGSAPKPENAAKGQFRSVMLATSFADANPDNLDPADYAAEWKWDGIRVQAISEGGVRRIYSRSGDDISLTFPDLLDAMDFEAAIDGELLVGSPVTGPRSFSDLQQRLNRKTVSAKMLKDYPVFVRAYDILFEGSRDMRELPFPARRERLSALVGTLDPERFDLSELVPFSSWQELDGKRCDPPHPIIEGVMLKRLDSTYLAGRPKGPWFKWKRDPYTVDAVLMYAQRGHGKRSSFYSDYTFGVWAGDEAAAELVPVGKAYFGFTDEELRQIDKYVRDNTVDRFGPVRAVRADRKQGLVLEVAFEGLNRSTRHKSGVAMRFPRISRLRWDKPSAEADRIETLTAMLDG